jgi:hypothetical protein
VTEAVDDSMNGQPPERKASAAQLEEAGENFQKYMLFGELS